MKMLYTEEYRTFVNERYEKNRLVYYGDIFNADIFKNAYLDFDVKKTDENRYKIKFTVYDIYREIYCSIKPTSK